MVNITAQYYCPELILHNVSPLRTRAIFYFAPVSWRVNMLSDTRAACVATALALCLKQEKNCRWIRVAQRKPHHTYENLMADVMMSQKYTPPTPTPDGWPIIWRATRTVAPNNRYKKYMRDAVTLRQGLSIKFGQRFPQCAPRCPKGPRPIPRESVDNFP